MEQKKNPKADLEKRKGLFLEIGLVVILAACLCAFSIKSYDKDESFVATRDRQKKLTKWTRFRTPMWKRLLPLPLLLLPKNLS